jgi:hypothetical protein
LDVFFQGKKVVIAKQLCPLDSWTFVVERHKKFYFNVGVHVMAATPIAFIWTSNNVSPIQSRWLAYFCFQPHRINMKIETVKSRRLLK